MGMNLGTAIRKRGDLLARFICKRGDGPVHDFSRAGTLPGLVHLRMEMNLGAAIREQRYMLAWFIRNRKRTLALPFANGDASPAHLRMEINLRR